MSDEVRMLGLALETSSVEQGAGIVRRELASVGGEAKIAQSALGTLGKSADQSAEALLRQGKSADWVAAREQVLARHSQEAAAAAVQSAAAAEQVAVATDKASRPVHALGASFDKMRQAAAQSSADAMAAQLKLLDPFQKAGEAGLASGDKIAKGARLAAIAMDGGTTSLRGFAVEAVLAGAAGAKGATGLSAMAAGANGLKAALTAIGGAPMLIVIAGIYAIGKAYEWSKGREEKWTEDQVKHFEEVGEAADKARERITKFVEQQRNLDRDASNAERQLAAFRSGGDKADKALELEKQREQIADRTRAAIIALRPEWAKFDDAVIRTHENYQKIHDAIVRTVTAEAGLTDLQKKRAEGAKLQADLVKEMADGQRMLLTQAAEDGTKALQVWLTATAKFEKDFYALLNGGDLRSLDMSAITGAIGQNSDALNARAHSGGTTILQDVAADGKRFEAAASVTANAIHSGINGMVGSIQSGSVSINNVSRIFAGGVASFVGSLAETVPGLDAAFGAAMNLINAQKQRVKATYDRIMDEVADLKNSDAYRAGVVHEGMSLDEARRARDAYVQSLERERAAIEKKNEFSRRAEREAEDIEREITRVRAHGNAEELLRIEREEQLNAAMTEANRELLKRLYAEQDAAKAYDEARRNAEAFADYIQHMFPHFLPDGTKVNPDGTITKPVDRPDQGEISRIPRATRPFTLDRWSNGVQTPDQVTPPPFVFNSDNGRATPETATTFSVFQGVTAVQGNILVDLARTHNTIARNHYTEARIQTVLLRRIAGGGGPIGQLTDHLQNQDQSRLVD